MSTEMSHTTTEATEKTAADFYDELFLQTLCLPWARHLTDRARLVPGEHVLDIACGTGAVAGVALSAVGGQGVVVGIDLSPDMLAVARRKLPELDWREGRAESLPFEDETFDVVLCQFGLMFFADRDRALREMHRVLRPGGRAAVAVWDGLERTPAYAALTGLVEQHLGPDAGAAVRNSFGLGDPVMVHDLLDAAGFTSVEAESVDAVAEFPSLRAWVDAEVRGWVGTGFTEEQYRVFFAAAEQVLAPYVRDDGTAQFALPAVVATGSTPPDREDLTARGHSARPSRG